LTGDDTPVKISQFLELICLGFDIFLERCLKLTGGAGRSGVPSGALSSVIYVRNLIQMT